MSRTPLSRLMPEVLTFATPSFELRNDLERLLDVREAGANEAVIFYASRILEALAERVERRAGRKIRPCAEPLDRRRLGIDGKDPPATPH